MGPELCWEQLGREVLHGRCVLFTGTNPRSLPSLAGGGEKPYSWIDGAHSQPVACVSIFKCLEVVGREYRDRQALGKFCFLALKASVSFTLSKWTSQHFS